MTLVLLPLPTAADGAAVAPRAVPAAEAARSGTAATLPALGRLEGSSQQGVLAVRPKPVLGGPKHLPGTSIVLVGPGKVRPSRIRLNPETAGCTRLRWSSWGGGTAIAHGRSCGEGYGPCADVEVRLTGLGSCNGVRACRNTAVIGDGRPYSVIRGCRLT